MINISGPKNKIIETRFWQKTKKSPRLARQTSGVCVWKHVLNESRTTALGSFEIRTTVRLSAVQSFNIPIDRNDWLYIDFKEWHYFFNVCFDSLRVADDYPCREITVSAAVANCSKEIAHTFIFTLERSALWDYHYKILASFNETARLPTDLNKLQI